MKHSYSFSLILLPLALLLALASTLFIQRAGITYEVSSRYYVSEQFLPDDIIEVKNFFSDKPVEALVIVDSQNTDKYMQIMVENVYATLDDMRVKYDIYDANGPANSVDLSKYQTVVFVVLDISRLDSETAAIMNWMEGGGKVMFAIRPDPSSTFSLSYRKLGIIGSAGELAATKGIEFVTDLLPGAKGVNIGLQFINGSSYPVELDENCIVHLISGEGNRIPLMWQCDSGQGRIVFINSDQFGDKAARGIFAAGYSLLSDYFVYPVINSSVLYIDDFPAPLPEGSDEYITRYYDMDTATFFRDVWWPDMENLATKYDLRYTGGMIETYTQQVTPPLVKQLEPETHKYFGRSLLAAGGEIIFHGHNHVPFCTADNDVNPLNDYPSWPNTESAQLSLSEVYTYANSVFPDYQFLGYMPPSNILCSDSRRWLPLVIPDLRYIASIYIPDEDAQEYVQEFTEASDGIIEFPRVVSGYNMYDDEYMQWAAINELNLHYVNSHFLHPDDLLDPDRGAEKGWADLRDQYDRFLQWLKDSAPGLRNMTGREGAMAVQRFARLAMETRDNNGALEITLGNFYDEAWLMLRSDKKPLSVDGGAATQVSSNLYLIQALDSKITVTFEE
ncbi:MAG: DUF2194 domain-containing protein [Anaerolineales bacterium]|nr:DUF2194 domain-containing protein [Anaerolineales bacterium]